MSNADPQSTSHKPSQATNHTLETMTHEKSHKPQSTIHIYEPWAKLSWATNHNLPAMSSEPSWATIYQPQATIYQPCAVNRELSHNLPAMSREPSHNLPAMSREPSHDLPAMSRATSHNLPAMIHEPWAKPSNEPQSMSHKPWAEPSHEQQSTSHDPYTMSRAEPQATIYQPWALSWAEPSWAKPQSAVFVIKEELYKNSNISFSYFYTYLSLRWGQKLGSVGLRQYIFCCCHIHLW